MSQTQPNLEAVQAWVNERRVDRAHEASKSTLTQAISRHLTQRDRKTSPILETQVQSAWEKLAKAHNRAFERANAANVRNPETQGAALDGVRRRFAEEFASFALRAPSGHPRQVDALCAFMNRSVNYPIEGPRSSSLDAALISASEAVLANKPSELWRKDNLSGDPDYLSHRWGYTALRLARLHLARGEVSEAQNVYDRLVANDSPIRDNAWVLDIGSYDNQGQQFIKNLAHDIAAAGSKSMGHSALA